MRQFKRFKQIFENEWKNKITREARFMQKVKKIDIEEIFPLAEDIKKFHCGLSKEVELAPQLLTEEKTEGNWRNLACLLLTKITAFNARRPLELGLITLAQFEKRIHGSSTNVDMIEMLTISEKVIAKSMCIVKVIGKFARIVPVLLTSTAVEKINLLHKLRESCKIESSNPYIFPQGAGNPLHAGRITTRIANRLKDKYGLEKSSLITAKQFRRVLSSSMQFLNLKDHDIENMCSHLGHDYRTHLNYNRLHSNAAELTKVSKISLLWDARKLEEHSRKSLEEIDFAMNGKSFPMYSLS